MLQAAYIVLGTLPSAIWLLYYLGKDLNPEPKRIIVKIFMGGALVTILAGIAETILIKYAGSYYMEGVYPSILLFMAIAFTEEFAKFLPVRLGQWRHRELDEPIDVSQYMITSALGFAAAENIFLFFTKNLKFTETLFISRRRFVGATFLHVLCSGLLGYFIALSFYYGKTHKRIKSNLLIVAGFVVATLLHTFYNFSIIKLTNYSRGIFLIILIGASALVLSFSIKHLQKLKSICKK